MEITKGWCLWYTSEEYLRRALTECTASNADHIQVVKSELHKNYPFLIIYFNHGK